MPTAISPIYLEERKPVTAVMDEALQTYIHDHLTGAAFALDVIAGLEKQDEVPVLRVFASRIRHEVRNDRDALVEMAAQAGMRRSGTREWLGRVAERFSRPTFQHKSKGLLGIFESLETLSLNILGKHALWCALESVPRFARLVDFHRLKERALEQHVAVDTQRLHLGRKLFDRKA